MTNPLLLDDAYQAMLAQRAAMTKRRQTFRGDSIVIDVQVLVPPPGAQPGIQPPPLVPANITGWFVWFTLKNHFGDPDAQAVAQITTTSSVPAGGSIALTNPAIGQLEIVCPPLATRLLADGDVQLLYDVQVKDTTGKIFTVEVGTLDVFPDVTNAIA